MSESTIATCTKITGLYDGVPAQDCPRPAADVDGRCVEHAAEAVRIVAEAAPLFDRL